MEEEEELKELISSLKPMIEDISDEMAKRVDDPSHGGWWVDTSAMEPEMKRYWLFKRMEWEKKKL